MDLKDILSIIVFCIVTVSYAATALISYFRGKKAKTDPAKVNEVFADIVSTVNQLVRNAEGAYESVTKGGALKLKDVLNDIKEKCVDGGIAFDKAYWTELIKSAVELINLNRVPEEKTTETNSENQTRIV